MATDLRSENESALSLIRTVLNQQADAILSTVGRLNDSANDAIRLLANRRSGRVVVTGMGKMGCIARKAAGTFCSTGTPSLFLHAAEAAHGDLGMVTDQDTVVALSNSGRTEDVLNMLPHLQRLKVPIICITGDAGSPLAVRSQVVIAMGIGPEDAADPPAPTSSTTVALAVCDALALTLARMRGFTREQFALIHPGGHIGRRLLMTTSALMRTGIDVPTVTAGIRLRDAIIVISAKRMGCTLVVDDQHRLCGILTDGDIRRILECHDNPLEHPVSLYMTTDCIAVDEETLAAESLQKMEQHEITVLPVVDAERTVRGIVHLHALVQAGLA